MKTVIGIEMGHSYKLYEPVKIMLFGRLVCVRVNVCCVLRVDSASYE